MWDDGNDVADLTAAVLEDAKLHGQTRVRKYFQHLQRYVPAVLAVTTIDVRVR